MQRRILKNAVSGKTTGDVKNGSGAGPPGQGAEREHREFVLTK